MHLPFRVTTVLGTVGCLLAITACGGTEIGQPMAPGSQLAVSITQKTDTLVPGATRQLFAMVTDAYGAAQPHTVTWSSSVPAVATVSASGVVSATAPGVTRVIATAGTAADSATIVVRSGAALIVEPSVVAIPLGEQIKLQVAGSSVVGNAMASASVQWTSSDPLIAVVNEGGIVTTTGLGDATLTAHLGSATGSASLSVKPNAVASIRVSPTNSSIYPRQAQQLDATLYDDNGRILPFEAAWSSSNTAIASVSATGVVTGVTKGSAIITAKVGGKRATASLTVLSVPVASVQVSAAAPAVAVGQSLQAAATLKDADGNVLTDRPIAWQSSNPALATVNSTGLVSGIAVGQVTISAIADAKVGSLALAATQTSVKSVAITPANGSAVIGRTAQLKAEARDAAGVAIAGKSFSWTSSKPAVATVSTTGLVTAVSVGTATITASAEGVAGTSAFTATSVPVTTVNVQPSSVQLTMGGTAQLAVSGSDATGAGIGSRVAQWTSSNPTVATVSSAGLVTAVSSGGTTITATVEGVSASAQVGVAAPPPAPVASIEVSFASGSITVGQTTQATAVLRDAQGHALTGRTVTWSSADGQLASVSASGVVTGLAAASATIVASAEGVTGVGSITINPGAPAPVASISLSAGSTSLVVGSMTQISVTLRDAQGNILTGRTLTFTSSAPSVATVNANGVVTAVAAGAASIRVASEGTSGSIGITVSGPGPIASITLSAAKTSLSTGEGVQVTAVARDANGTLVPNAAFTWSSSNTSVLNVAGLGLATGIGAGTAQARATNGSVVGTLSMTVTVPLTQPPPPSGSRLAELPRAFVDTRYVGATGRQIRVAAGGDLQGALDSAQPGDEVLLAAGATFTGNFRMNPKGGSGWITIRPDFALSNLPPAGTRMTPGMAASLALPRIQGGNSSPALEATSGASGWRVVGIEITMSPSVPVAYTIVAFGDGSRAQNTLSLIPRRLLLDRVWVHGNSGLDVRRGLGVQCGECGVIDSWISDITSASDAAAVWGWNGPGPIVIVNNQLEATGENIMFGGADPAIQGMNISDIEIRQNYIIKPLRWQGGPYLIKNLIEFKNAVRVLIEGNVLENSWVHAQAGFAIVWWATDQEGTAPWATTSDITFRYNRVNNAAGGFQLTAHGDRSTSPWMTRVTIRHNLFTNIGTSSTGGGNGKLYQLNGPLSDMVIEHNTGFAPTSSVYFVGGATPMPGLSIRDNILGNGDYNVYSAVGQGTAAIVAYAGTENAFKGNVVVKPWSVSYPSGNYMTADLSAVGFAAWPSSPQLGGGSPYQGRATDGTDPGANVQAVVAATQSAFVSSAYVARR